MADPDDDDRKMPAVDNKAASSMEQEESNDEQSDANEARDSQKSTVGGNKQQSGSSEEDGQDSSSDSDSSSSSDDDSRDEEDEDEDEPTEDKVVLGEDGHPLSAYEIQRLDRIRRNKEYLASLGLEKNTLARAAKPAKQPKPARKKHPDLKRRSSISRASKEKAISYSEHKDKEGNTASGDTKKEPWKRPKENRAARMERFIHDEFRRIGKEQRHHLKRAKKNVRAADVEYRIAKQRAERYERKRRQQVETQQIIARMEEERRALGGHTARGMLQEFDMRSSEIFTALRLFDERFNHHEDMGEWAKQQEENQRKMEIIDAMDRFPRALKDAVRDLDMMLLERSPRDPAPPRRGTRKRKSVDSAEEEEPDAKMRAIESPDGSKARLAAGSTWGSLASAITAETLSSSAGAHLEKASPSVVVDEPDSKPAAKENSKKKRRDVIPKIVGGWVSPEFANDIDRSWLEADSIPKKFDLSSYIPQVGDTILYYPAGHRQFLEANPDVLGKKTRNITRLTLWDRAKKEKAKLEKAAAEENGESKATKEISSNAPTWWNEEWLSLIEGDLERYPIICRVEKTHAEFPPDPNADKKTVIKDNENGSVQVTWAVKKGGKMKKQVNEPLRLAVMLRPLTPLLPPRQLEGDDAADEDLTLPPNFNVVTFPSKASPFLVPFSWAYRLSHSLSEGASIRLVSKSEWSGNVKSFKSLDGRESSRLDDKVDAIRRLCAALKSGPKPFAASLEEALVSNGRASIPITDACTVIERFEAALKRSGNDIASSSQPARDKMTSLMELVRSTLPLWNEVIAGSGTGKKLEMSAWELSPVDSKSVALAGPLHSISADIDAETGLVYRIDEPLRAKIECTIEDFLRDTPDAAMFCPLVSDEDAPSYSCAVPRGMAFNKILRRLRPGNRVGGPRCYYRSIDSLLGDISSIADNCILYNSLDSYVVEKVLEIVPAVKRLIAQVASSHFKEKEAREKSAEERRQAIMLQFNAPVLLDDENEQGESKSRSRGSTKQQNLQPPYTEFLDRSWIQDTEPDKSWDISIQRAPNRPSDERTPTFEVVGSGWWVPQSGDTVFYSRSLHAEFVKGHHPSLTTDQCELPRFSGDNDMTPQSESQDAVASDNSLVDSLQKRWLVGKVVWVRAAFPRAPSKRDSDYENTFDVASPVLDLGIRFNYSWALNKVYKVSWRPCTFQGEQPVHSEDTPSSNEQGKSRETQDSNDGNLANAGYESKKPAARDRCGACHLNTDTSFVRPAWIPFGSEDSAEGENSSPYLLPDGSIPADNLFSLPTGIPSELISSIDRCLNLLKRRCLDGVPADHIDPRLSIENVKKGFAPPAAKIGKSLPSFDRVLAKGNLGGAEAATRGIEKFDKSAVKLLADANYLPQWMLSLSEGTKKTNRDGIAQSLALHETLSPNPNFSLELIQTRLRNGYYRSVGSLAHDIEEAYISSVLLLLAKPASAKQGQAVSIRRIAKALSVSKDAASFAKGGAKKNANKVVSGNEAVVPSNDVERHGPKKSGLSEKEQQWVEKLLQVRKLYSTALACAVQPDCMERVFGTVPKKKPKTVPKNKSSITDEREQTFRKARNTLGFIYHALSRDPCDNRPPEASWNPSIKLKIRFTCQEAPVKETSNDEEGVENESELDIDTTKPIVIEPADYEDNDALVQFFFGRPGRMHTCARCNAYSRLMMMCRVRKKHSRPDFDWTSVFQGTGGIDGLLYTLRTGQQPSEVEASEHMPSLTSQPPVSLPSNQATATVSAAMVDDDIKQVDPASLLEKAVAAVSLANSVLEKAEKFSKDTVRLSEEFVGAYFPIDPADGHYNYCILCGLIGDVICCEGCPNVVHPHCVNLTEIPSEDWYCSKCVRTGKVPSVGTESQKPSAVAVASAGADVLPASMAAPYGLDDEAERLEAMLGELKAARPIRPKKPKRATNEQKDGDSGGDDDGGDDDDDAEEEENQPPSSPVRRSRRSCAADPSSPGDEGDWQFKVNNELRRVARKDTGRESTKKRSRTAHVENTDAKKPSQKRSRPRANKHLRDALHVLSTMALAFLESIDITTADQFLSTRTSELANDFMAWREQEKMTTLKGSGHSATISGWKAAVRKAAESMGDDDLAMTDHSSDDAEEEDQSPSSSSGDDAGQDVRSQPKRIRVGTRVKKKFGKQYYLGTVLECPSSENPFYLVRYEDDDEEDMDEDELRQCILGPTAKRPKRRESASRAAQSEEDNSDNDAEQAKASGRPQRTRARSSSAIQEGDVAVKTKRRGRTSRNTVLAEDSEDTADGPKKRPRHAKVSPSMTRRSRARRTGS